MKIIGFNLTKILVEKIKEISKSNINNHIEFQEIEKENVELLKDSQASKLSFKYSLTYSNNKDEKELKDENKQAEILFKGFIILALDKAEAKDFQKYWKKKQVPPFAVSPLYNFILKRCSAKSVYLQEEVGIPSPYLKIPQVRPPEENN
jgi:hypothetical protein